VKRLSNNTYLLFMFLMFGMAFMALGDLAFRIEWNASTVAHRYLTLANNPLYNYPIMIGALVCAALSARYLILMSKSLYYNDSLSLVQEVKR